MQVCFVLPVGSAQILRQLPGFAHYDERYHCLQCLVPGTGTGDAPRAFNLKLTGVLHNPVCKFKAASNDPELEICHDNGKLKALGGKHVDDVKIGGTKEQIQLTQRELEKVSDP